MCFISLYESFIVRTQKLYIYQMFIKAACEMS